MSEYQRYAAVLARVTGRGIVMEVQPEFCNSSSQTFALDMGFLDAPEMIAAGSCLASFDNQSTPFYISGAFRNDSIYF
jgi:hypothetical protein